MKAKLIVVCTGILIFIIGWFAHSILENNPETARAYPVRQDSSKYQYINTLILIDNSTTIYEELNPLRDEVKKYIDNEILDRRAERISFYFRDLNNSMWTGVNPDDKFVPASILKVVTMMVYLRAAEEDPNVMNQKLFYRKNSNERQNYPPSAELESGYYGVGRLIGQSIIESDNAAASALYENRAGEYPELYNALRLPYQPEKLSDYMSPRQVSNIFRALYGSTYLLNTYSEQLLEFLTQTKFNKGITQGVDLNIKVAHKFGEHTVYYPNNVHPPDYQLHDCGIVYYPEKPYFICVMTEGKNLENLEKIIGNISSITFKFVKDQL